MCYMVFFGGHDKRIVSKVLKAPRELHQISKITMSMSDVSNLNFHFKWKSENTLNNHELTGKTFLNCIILFMELKVRPNIHETLLHYGFLFKGNSQWFILGCTWKYLSREYLSMKILFKEKFWLEKPCFRIKHQQIFWEKFFSGKGIPARDIFRYTRYLHVNISHLSFTFKYSFGIYFSSFCYGFFSLF